MATHRLFILFVSVLSPVLAHASDISGTVTSASELKPSQSSVVIWVEGIEGVANPGEIPVITQSGIQFSPKVLAVVKGQTVSFPNEDDVAHNVFSLSEAKKFKLGIYPKGEKREVTFEKAGVIDLFCTIHRHMHAVVVVVPSPYFAQTEIGKPFVIPSVPPGEYTVKVWNAKLKVKEHKVVVPESGKAEVVLGYE